MGRIDRDELLRRVDLADLLDRLSPSADRPVRRRWRCVAPEHEDRHPSVSIRVVDGIGRWRCWSCGRGGTAIDALGAAQGLTVAQAMDQLSARALPRPINHEPADSEPVPLHPSVRRYADACHRILRSSTGRPVLEWLTVERCLDPEVLHANHVGADPGPTLLPRRRGLPRSGVAAVLPAFYPDGALGYVQTRYLDPSATSKYGNPTRRLGTNPGLAWTMTPEPRRRELLVVCEGIIDALTAATAGLHAVAVLGASYPSVGVAQAIADHTAGRHSVIAFDADEAGRVAAERLQQLLVPRGSASTILELPDGTDLNTLAQTTSGWSDELFELAGVPA